MVLFCKVFAKSFKASQKKKNAYFIFMFKNNLYFVKIVLRVRDVGGAFL